MSGLGRYPGELKRIADELSEYLCGPVRDAAFRLLTMAGEDSILVMEQPEIEMALKLLSQTPAQREKALAKLDDQTAAKLLLRARVLGLTASYALQFAEQFEYVPGKSYSTAPENTSRPNLLRQCRRYFRGGIPKKKREIDVVDTGWAAYDDDETWLEP